jgi:hypothetical protein
MDFDIDKAYIISAKWVKNKQKHVLRILPKHNGATTITIHVADSVDIPIISDTDTLKLNVFVVDDSNWIPFDYMDQLEIENISDQANEIMGDADCTEDDPTISDTAVKYNGNEIRYKFDDVEVFFNSQDLKAANIL